MNLAMTWIVALALTLFGVAQAQQGKLIFIDVRGYWVVSPGIFLVFS